MKKVSELRQPYLSQGLITYHISELPQQEQDRLNAFTKPVKEKQFETTAKIRGKQVGWW